jgi:hypothetical protein
MKDGAIAAELLLQQCSGVKPVARACRSAKRMKNPVINRI